MSWLLQINDKISKYKFDLQLNDLKAPVKKGQIVGKVKIFNDKGKLVTEAKLTVNENTDKANIWDLFKRNLKSALTFN